VGTSKGALFHYFDSKAALLAAVIDRMVEVATRQVTPIATDPRLTALDKLQGVFDGIAQWKRAQPEFQPAAVADLVRTWYSDENTLVLARLRDAVGTRLTPLLVDILRQGMAEGTFSVSSAEGAASVFTALMLGLNDAAIRLFLARRDGAVSFDTVMGTLTAYAEAFERILGIPPLSWPLVDEATVRFWFDEPLHGMMTPKSAGHATRSFVVLVSCAVGHARTASGALTGRSVVSPAHHQGRSGTSAGRSSAGRASKSWTTSSDPCSNPCRAAAM
jgi:AcrR family transcriptional regulator